MSSFPIITLLTATPLAGGCLLLLVPPTRSALARRLALALSLVSLALAGGMWSAFDVAAGRPQFEERHAWIPTLAVEYFVAVDGLGLLMVMLAALVTPIAILASWKIEERASVYHALVLFVQGGLFGTFTALNFFHWFLFWELGLVPAFFLVKLWGGPRSDAAATQFFLYTMAGSVALLLAFLALRLATGTFDLLELANLARRNELGARLSTGLGWAHSLGSAENLSLCLGGMVFFGFAVKVPVIPFHTWLPATYAEAPTGTTILLTGAMSKMGLYGLLRLLVPIFPAQVRLMLWPLLGLAVATIVLSAAAAFAQRDLKRLLAYSSVNHLGYCLLGLFAAMESTGPDLRLAGEKTAALNGVLLQMFNHGLTASLLFCFLGFLEQRSGGLRGLEDFGGLRRVAPVFCGLMGISLFASLGLPGLNGFVGEFLIFKGAFPLATWATVLSTFGLLLTAVFLLTLAQRVFHGPLNERWASFPDLSLGERLSVAPGTVLLFVLGLCPQLVIQVINPTMLQFVDRLQPALR